MPRHGAQACPAGKHKPWGCCDCARARSCQQPPLWKSQFRRLTPCHPPRGLGEPPPPPCCLLPGQWCTRNRRAGLQVGSAKPTGLANTRQDVVLQLHSRELTDLFAEACKSPSPLAFYEGVGPYPASFCFQQQSSDPSCSAYNLPHCPSSHVATQRWDRPLTWPSYSENCSGRAGTSSPGLGRPLHFIRTSFITHSPAQA